jgi:probable nitrogen fixation protein
MQTESNPTTQPSDANSASVAELPFLKVLIGLIRAEDSYGAWERKTDLDLLREFVVTKEERRALPIIGDPDPEVTHRVEQFYRAVGQRIEQRTGLMASPTLNLSHEGFGRLFITVGKLVALSKTLRDVHRFGFDSLQALADEGEKNVDKAMVNIQEFPLVANA